MQNSKKYFLIKIVFIIIFLSFQNTIKAQAFGVDTTIQLPTVDVRASLNTSEYLWNLLKQSYEDYAVKDTSLYYAIDFSISTPDSSAYSLFKGVLLVEYNEYKPKVFLCDGTYEELNQIELFEVSTNLSIFFRRTKIASYRKFKKHKLSHNKSLTSFKRSFTKKHKLESEIYIDFDNKIMRYNKILKSTLSYSFKEAHLFSYRANYSRMAVDYKFINNVLLTKTASFLVKYSFKYKERLLFCKITNITGEKYAKKIPVKKTEKPRSLFRRLEKNDY